MVDKIGIIGGGSWATAITKILHDNGHELMWWLRKQETVDYLKKYNHNPDYLSTVTFDLDPDCYTNNLHAVIEASDWIVFVVPSSYIKDVFNQIPKQLLKDKKIISAVKGIVREDQFLISQYLNKILQVPLEQIANISGPCHAEEVAAEKLSYLTFASPNTEMAKSLTEIFANRYVNTHWNNDLQGTEYAAVLKNVYALAAGISLGMGYGDNFRAVLISKAIEEMQHFLGNVIEGERNVLHSPYLGDLLVTAYSQHSRNRSFGLMIGRGYSVNAAILELNMVAEGYYSSYSLHKIAEKHHLDMPILKSVYKILYEKDSLHTEMQIIAEKLN